jgi:hypothetical protein
MRRQWHPVVVSGNRTRTTEEPGDEDDDSEHDDQREHSAKLVERHP